MRKALKSMFTAMKRDWIDAVANVSNKLDLDFFRNSRANTSIFSYSFMDLAKHNGTL